MAKEEQEQPPRSMDVEPEAPPATPPDAYAPEPATPARRSRSRTRPRTTADDGREKEAPEKTPGPGSGPLEAEVRETVEEGRSRAQETWEAVSERAEQAVRRTAKATRKTASIIGLKFKKALRRKSLQDVYREIGETYYLAVKGGRESALPDVRVQQLVDDADRLKEEIAELERKEEAVRGM
jgi:hypothetical protein